jgi:hypothetical protein
MSKWLFSGLLVVMLVLTACGGVGSVDQLQFDRAREATRAVDIQARTQAALDVADIRAALAATPVKATSILASQIPSRIPIEATTLLPTESTVEAPLPLPTQIIPPAPTVTEALLLPTATQVVRSGARPGGGSIILDERPGSGKGVLKIENGTESDGVVILTHNDDQPVVAIYVRSTSTAQLNGVPDGVYYVYFTTGTGWDEVNKTFIETSTYQRFDDTLDFTSSSSQYSIWTLTLQPVTGGTASTSSIDPANFPRLSP